MNSNCYYFKSKKGCDKEFWCSLFGKFMAKIGCAECSFALLKRREVDNVKLSGRY